MKGTMESTESGTGIRENGGVPGTEGKYEMLKLENQLCFPLYAAARDIVKKYNPYLEKIDLTYTQYIVMMVLWEHKMISARELGKKLFLDSGTLTPVLKSLEKKGFVRRQRSSEDERVLLVTVTPEGIALRDRASAVPNQVANCIRLDAEEAMQLYALLYKLLAGTQ